ncbi:hypothetical protein ZWY2020_000125 [Hordeum vulgare]|nr:hypothetical protein ZWY2020_000125 [Hordeum vulgare]
MLKQATDKPIEEAYLEAFRRLPVDAMPDLAECAYLGGYCIGILDPVSNIILNTLNLLAIQGPAPANTCQPSYPQHLARFYIHLSGGDLVVAICIAEIELTQSTTIMQEDHIAVCHSNLFRNRAKLGLRIAAIKVDHPMPDDLLLLFQGQPTEAMRSLLATLEEGRCLSVNDVETFIKVLHYQHLVVPTDPQLTLPRTPSSPTDSGFGCRFNLNDGAGTMAATVTFQRREAFNLGNLRSSKYVLSKIRSSIGLMQGFTQHTPMEVADAAPTCQHIHSIKMSLLDIIHAFYVKALAKLPNSYAQRFLRAIMAAGHCYGLLDPVSNIIIHAVWYDVIAPPRHNGSKIQPDTLGATALRRLELRSLNGLIAAVRVAKDFSEHKAVQYLRSIRCDLSIMPVMWQSPQKSVRILHHASKAESHPLEEHHMSSLGFLFDPATASYLDYIFKDAGNPLSDAFVTNLHLVCQNILPSSFYGIAPQNTSVPGLPEIAPTRHNLEQKQLFLRGELGELLRLYAIQHPSEPLYKVEMICGVDEHTRLFYSHCYHLNFLAAPQALAPHVLFFAQILKPTSQSKESDGGSFCCPLPYYDANNFLDDAQCVRSV